MTRLYYRCHSRLTLSKAISSVVRAAVECLESRMFLNAGGLDLTFGNGGTVLADFPGKAALQSDGKILVLNGTRLISRYTADGKPDTSFGINGATALPYSPATFAVRGDNKIVIASYDPSNSNDVILSRYMANGQVDTSFGGGDGEITEPFFGGDQTGPKIISKMLIRPDNNRIYLLGNVSPADNGLYDWALAAYNDTGDPYSEFSPLTTTHWGYTSVLNDAILTADNKIVAVGAFAVSDSHHPDVQEDFAVARYDEHGQPDNSFSGDGQTLINFGVDRELDPAPASDASFDVAQSVAVDANNNLVVGGFSSNPLDDTAPYYTSLARLKADGTLDATFGPGGFDGDGRLSLLLGVRGSTSTPIEVSSLPQGKVLLATAGSGSADRDFVLARLDAAGALDNTFGAGGKVSTNFGGDDSPGSLLLQSGKAVLVGASIKGTQSKLAMARYQLQDASPFSGTSVNLPGTVQFENFDNGGEGIAYHDTDTVNQGGAYRNTGVDIQPISAGGFNLGFAKAGEWTQYTVNVAQEGDYDLEIRLASLQGGGFFNLKVDANFIGTGMRVPQTRDWSKYDVVEMGMSHLSAGTHVIRLEMSANDGTGYVANFDSLQVKPHTTPTTQTPFGGTPFTTPGRLQLENYDEGGEGVAYHDTEAANLGGVYRNSDADVEAIPATSGGGYALDFAKAGEWTEYTFVVPPLQGASYDLALRYAAPRGGVVNIEIDGTPVSQPVTLRNTASWQDYQLDFPAFNVSLTPGTHVLRLSQISNGSYGYVANFDYLEFQRYREPFYSTPFNPGETIQAEDYDTGGEGWTYHDTDPANLSGAYRPADGVDIEPTTDTGGGYNVGFAKAGEWIEYTVNGLTSGDGLFGIEVRIASLRAGGKFHFEVDGATVASFVVPATGSWQTYTTLSSAKNVRLTPGAHRLRLVMDQNNSTGYVANFNWMKVN